MTTSLDRTTARTADGSELAVQTSGTGPALLLLPGQSNSHLWWNGLRERFADAFTTITFDYRGTGASRAEVTRESVAEWSTRLFADDAVRVLRALGLPRADVYGASMGGRIAQWMAIEHPESVDHLVLACTSPGGALGVERSRDVRRRLADRDPRVRRETLLDLFYTPAWRDSGRRSLLLGDPTMSARALTGHLRASDAHDASARLHEIGAPTLVLHGDADLMAPVANAHSLHGEISGSELALTVDGRHGFFDEFAEEVTARIRRFLAKG